MVLVCIFIMSFLAGAVMAELHEEVRARQEFIDWTLRDRSDADGRDVHRSA